MNTLSVYQQHNLLYDQESFAMYKRGGYHPVKIGDSFTGNVFKKYRVVHKLGHGGYSTVWLVEAAHPAAEGGASVAEKHPSRMWLSLKIVVADAGTASREAAMLGRLKNEPGIVQLIDSFTHTSDNGIHLCLVQEMLGPSLGSVVQTYCDDKDELEPEVILKLSRQLLVALKSLYARKLVHKNDILKIVGKPQVEEIERVDGKPLGRGLPVQIVRKAGWGDWVEEDENDIRLLDFGESFSETEQPAILNQPINLRVPETIFTKRFDHRVDLWQAESIIHLLLFDYSPFMADNLTSQLVNQMIHFTEEDLPAEWQPAWEAMEKAKRPTSTLARRFQDQVKDKHLKRLKPVIEQLMRFRPADRIEAKDALVEIDRITAGM
ncbi:kinase-like domain-containing protein [Podospora didyma]|uniref:non-specific serine/threonine protein kinase n=1 Tax=Podospora didyma TaxID=330526 RepID=A0AAE0P5T1_9PEZI|nr:kinase-like domain-containing protein [Podospora didyma]